MNHETMENLIIIKGNHANWTMREKDDLIETALSKYMETKRKLKLDNREFGGALGVGHCQWRKYWFW